MSTTTVTLTGVCSGGGHLTFVVTGDAELTRTLDLSTITDPITGEDVEAFLRVICKLAKKGRTLAQARTLLQAGVEVIV